MKTYLLIVWGTILALTIISCERDPKPVEGSYLYHNSELYTPEEVVSQEIINSMVYVEGGTFQMGATSEQGIDADNDESPVHQVTVSSFYMGETEVTQKQWYAIMENNNPYWFYDGNLPVQCVSWYDCQEFIQKLNQLTGKTFRLPTEAEWEYAARGGNRHSGYKYSGSNTVGDVAWYESNSQSQTCPVKTKGPNALGLYDMSGNVCEWCSDWYESYSSEAQTNPQGPSTGSCRVLRGGSCWHAAEQCRVSCRFLNEPSIGHNGNGFRLVMEVEEGNQEALPNVITKPVNNITNTTATFNGSVTSDSWVSSRGFCWGTSSNPTLDNCLSHISVGNGSGDFSYNISGLSTGTTYYVRAWATNSAGTEYGESKSFTTLPSTDGQPCPNAATVIDYDENIYPTVKIGAQCWMAKNLRTTHYADGTSIAYGNNISNPTIAYYYYPNNNTSTVFEYGLLYNWKAVMYNSESSDLNPSGVQGICPTGWHVPSDAEWTQLTDYLKSQSVYWCNEDNNNIAKAISATTGWFFGQYDSCEVCSHLNSNNISGLNLSPSGYFNYFACPEYGISSSIWSSTNGTYGGNAWYRHLSCGYEDLGRSQNIKDNGFSVRCLHD